MEYSVFETPPVDFSPSVEVASCYLEYHKRLLLLKRHPEKPQGNKWGAPAGKMKKNETSLQTVIREIDEKIGVDIHTPETKYMGHLYCRLPRIDYVFHMFYHKVLILPKIKLELSEHVEMQWVTHEEALTYPLMAGAIEVLAFYEQFLKNSKI